MTETAVKPTRPLTVEECASQVRRAANYVLEAEAKHKFHQDSAVSAYDEVKVARRTLQQAEKNLLAISKKSPGSLPGVTKVTTLDKTKVS